MCSSRSIYPSHPSSVRMANTATFWPLPNPVALDQVPSISGVFPSTMESSRFADGQMIAESSHVRRWQILGSSVHSSSDSGTSRSSQNSKTPVPTKAKLKTKKLKVKNSEGETSKPKRPLTSYNIFFQEERKKLLDKIPDTKQPPIFNKKNPSRAPPHGKIPFQTLAKLIGIEWKKCNEDRRQHYQGMADQDRKRYDSEMEVWKSKQAIEMSKRQEKLAQQIDPRLMQDYLSRQAQSKHHRPSKSAV